jgi:hypothetical protein
MRYVVVSAQPLNVDLYAPVKLSIGRRHLHILDADGQEFTVRILDRTPAMVLRQ